MTIGISLVGAGGFARMHLEAYKSDPRAKVLWICDPDLERAKKYAVEYDIPNVTANYEESLIDTHVKSVDITAPNFLHKQVSIKAMEAGKAVLCEKPMALDPKESQEMADASRRLKQKLFVKYHQRFDLVHQRAKQMIDSGEFENPVLGFVTLFANHLPSMLNPNHWRGIPSLCGGGCLFSSGSHLLDLIHFFFGDLKAITAVNRQLVANDPNKGDDNAAVIMEFKNGVLCHFIGCWTSDYGTHRSKEIHGTKGSLSIVEIGGDKGTNTLYHKTKTANDVILEAPDWFRQSNFAAIRHFLDYYEDRTDPLYPLEACINSMRTLELAYLSSELGKRIVVVS
ncbi:MAG: oxidoreductase domain protein [Paenibacillus sp.]|jgi:predicted dehydrogenase|nr:oxidoreductase domain protein [Paenibacillus sp.]